MRSSTSSFRITISACCWFWINQFRYHLISLIDFLNLLKFYGGIWPFEIYIRYNCPMHSLLFLFKCRVCCNYACTWSATWSSLLEVILSSHIILRIGVMTLVRWCYRCMISITSVSHIKETWIDSGIAHSFLIDNSLFCFFIPFIFYTFF